MFVSVSGLGPNTCGLVTSIRSEQVTMCIHSACRHASCSTCIIVSHFGLEYHIRILLICIGGHVLQRINTNDFCDPFFTLHHYDTNFKGSNRLPCRYKSFYIRDRTNYADQPTFHFATPSSEWFWFTVWTDPTASACLGKWSLIKWRETGKASSQ